MQSHQTPVTPAQAGVHCLQAIIDFKIRVVLTAMDPGLRRGDDDVEVFRILYTWHFVLCII